MSTQAERNDGEQYRTLVDLTWSAGWIEDGVRGMAPSVPLPPDEAAIQREMDACEIMSQHRTEIAEMGALEVRWLALEPAAREAAEDEMRDIVPDWDGTLSYYHELVAAGERWLAQERGR